MATINRAAKEISVKVVYYGPGLCGKTTNLQKIYDTANPDKRGKLLSVATETDRTLFFDFLPIDLGTIKGLKLKVGLYTVPGQVFYDATRRLVLRGADGVVFVADSQPAMLDNNIESLENLKTNLRLNNLDPDSIPLVIQLNKRDLPNALDEVAMNEALNWRRVPVRTAAAARGMGVHETLKEIVKSVMGSLNDKVDGAGGTVNAAAMAPQAPAAAATPPVVPPVAPPPPANAPNSPPAVAPATILPAEENRLHSDSQIVEAMGADEAPPVIEDAPIVNLADLAPAAAPDSPPAAAVVAPPSPPAAVLPPASAAPVAAPLPSQPPSAAPTPPPRPAPSLTADMRDDIFRTRVQMLESQIAAVEAILGEMRAELAALKRL